MVLESQTFNLLYFQLDRENRSVCNTRNSLLKSLCMTSMWLCKRFMYMLSSGIRCAYDKQFSIYIHNNDYNSLHLNVCEIINSVNYMFLVQTKPFVCSWQILSNFSYIYSFSRKQRKTYACSFVRLRVVLRFRFIFTYILDFYIMYSSVGNRIIIRSSILIRLIAYIFNCRNVENMCYYFFSHKRLHSNNSRRRHSYPKITSLGIRSFGPYQRAFSAATTTISVKLYTF